MTDCLIIGHNDGSFDDLVETLRSMGVDHPDFRDLNINYIEYENKPYRALDILDRFYYEGSSENYRRFHNSDLLWNTILYLGTFISKRGFSFDYINLFQPEKDKLKEKLLNNEYMTIAITTTVYTMVDPIMEVISFIKQYNNKAKIIVGGPFISKQAENMKADDLQLFLSLIGADFFVLSREGEEALCNVLKALKENGSFSDIKNIAFKDNSRYIITEKENVINPLEENMIDYSLFNKEDIGESINVRISKGCPFSCSYCGFPLRAEKYKYLDVKNIIEDFDAIDSLGTVKNLFFIDDSVNIPKARFKELMKAMARKNYGFSWNCFLRCDQCDEETIMLMKEAKCEGVFLGLESSDEQLLINMNKTSRKEHFEETIPLFKKAGMAVFVSVFTGFPGETYETFWNTVDFIEKVEADFYRPQLWYCDPVTPIWQQRVKFGLKGINFAWSHNTMDVKTACDLNDWVLLYLDDPIWAPDPGFNFISVYYLKHRGMTIEQVKTFLRCFNAVVKEKLVYPNKKGVSPGLIEALKLSCRFNGDKKPDMSEVQRYSGKEYRKTEKFLLEEFYTQEEASRIGRFRYSALPSAGRILKRQAPVFDINQSVVNELGSRFNVDESHILFAACNIVISRLRGSEDLKVVAGVDGHAAVPARINVPGVLNVSQLLKSTKQKLDRTKEYEVFALHVLTSSLEYDKGMLEFDYAFIDNKQEPDSLEKYNSSIYNRLGLIVKVVENNGIPACRLEYTPEMFSGNLIDEFGTYLDKVLFELSEKEEIVLSDMSFMNDSKEVLLEEFAAKEFNF